MEIRPNSAQIDDDVNADEKHDIYSILYGQSLTDNFLILNLESRGPKNSRPHQNICCLYGENIWYKGQIICDEHTDRHTWESRRIRNMKRVDTHDHIWSWEEHSWFFWELGMMLHNWGQWRWLWLWRWSWLWWLLWRWLWLWWLWYWRKQGGSPLYHASDEGESWWGEAAEGGKLWWSASWWWFM